MIQAILLWLGFIPLVDACDALADAWSRVDRVEAELENEVRWSADGCATALDEIGALVPAVVARHAA